MAAGGENVRLIREQMGISVRALAKAANIESSTLSRIETGKQPLSEKVAEKVSKALNVSPGLLFADPGVLETSMLHMRKAPLLTPSQLLSWTGPENFEEGEGQVYLHAAISTGSRHLFGLEVVDSANAPDIRRGDLLLFDAMRQPRRGDLVCAQSRAGLLAIGRLRLHSINEHGAPTSYDVVPQERLYPEVSAADPRGFLLRGVLAEQRRVIK